MKAFDLDALLESVVDSEAPMVSLDEHPKTTTKTDLTPSSDFHYSGPRAPRVVFVLSDDVTPTLEERLRAQPLVNEDGVTFAKRYLENLGMTRNEIGVAWCSVDTGVEKMQARIAELDPQAIVYLGDVRGSGHKHECVNLPRFSRRDDVWKMSYREEVDRKLKALRRVLDAKASSVAPSLRPLLKAARPQDGDGISANAKMARLFKANAPKRIVYGVVLDPYQIDLQGDWIPAADIESTAHDFVSKRGYISYQHEGKADAELVESFVEPYPTSDDEQRAHRNEPHRAYRRKYGADTVHSGAWVMAVKLSPRLWAEYEAGNLNAFSIEGFGTRTDMESGDMPQVSFVDLEAI